MRAQVQQDRCIAYRVNRAMPVAWSQESEIAGGNVSVVNEGGIRLNGEGETLKLKRRLKSRVDADNFDGRNDDRWWSMRDSSNTTYSPLHLFCRLCVSLPVILPRMWMRYRSLAFVFRRRFASVETRSHVLYSIRDGLSNRPTAVAPFPVTPDPKTLVSLYRRSVACNTGNSV